MNYRAVDLDELDLGPQVALASNAGSRTFGNTLIAWDPSDTEPAVKVTVSLGGTVIREKTLRPTDNRMTYDGRSGADSSQGAIDASFGPDGKTGQLNGTLRWVYQGSPGNFQGFIGAW